MSRQSDFSGQGAALLTEPLRGYRCWDLELHVSDNHGWDAGLGYSYVSRRKTSAQHLPYLRSGERIEHVMLTPVSANAEPWRREYRATCVVNAHHNYRAGRYDVPVERCSCGVYSWYRIEEALNLHTGPIVGVIDVSGDAILGERGIRSARGKIMAIAPTDGFTATIVGMYVTRRELINALRSETAPGQRYAGVEVFDSVGELRRAYPPDLDTVANLIGERTVKDLTKDEGTVVATLGSTRVAAAQVVVAPGFVDKIIKIKHLVSSRMASLLASIHRRDEE